MPEFVAVDEEFVPKIREYKKGPKGPRARTEEQQEWDKAFEHAMNGKGYLAVQVTPDEAQEATKRVVSAARIFERAVSEGEPRPGTTAGTVILSWAIRVPKKRKPKDAATVEAPEGD
jgi:hypothetical protein